MLRFLSKLCVCVFKMRIFKICWQQRGCSAKVVPSVGCTSVRRGAGLAAPCGRKPSEGSPLTCALIFFVCFCIILKKCIFLYLSVLEESVRMCHPCVSIWGSADFYPLFALFLSNLAAVTLLGIQRSGAGPHYPCLWDVTLNSSDLFQWRTELQPAAMPLLGVSGPSRRLALCSLSRLSCREKLSSRNRMSMPRKEVFFHKVPRWAEDGGRPLV